jgi:hypothetical protein
MDIATSRHVRGHSNPSTLASVLRKAPETARLLPLRASVIMVRASFKKFSPLFLDSTSISQWNSYKCDYLRPQKFCARLSSGLAWHHSPSTPVPVSENHQSFSRSLSVNKIELHHHHHLLSNYHYSRRQSSRWHPSALYQPCYFDELVSAYILSPHLGSDITQNDIKQDQEANFFNCL